MLQRIKILIRGKGFKLLTIIVSIVAFLLIIFNISSSKEVIAKQKLFPDFSSDQDINKITLITPYDHFDFIRQNDQWLYPKGINYPVDPKKIEYLFKWISSIHKISEKTPHPEEFHKIGLVQPLKKNIPAHQKATRLIIYKTGSKNPIVNFFIGDIYRNYISYYKKRFFARLAQRESFVAESIIMPPLNMRHFLENIPEIPSEKNVKKIAFYIKDKKEFEFHATTHKEKIYFSSKKMIDDKVLIYPEVVNDYSYRLLSQIVPKKILMLPHVSRAYDYKYKFYLDNGDIVTIALFEKNKQYFMVANPQKAQSLKPKRIYQFSYKDYKAMTPVFADFFK